MSARHLNQISMAWQAGKSFNTSEVLKMAKKKKEQQMEQQ